MRASLPLVGFAPPSERDVRRPSSLHSHSSFHVAAERESAPRAWNQSRPLDIFWHRASRGGAIRAQFYVSCLFHRSAHKPRETGQPHGDPAEDNDPITGGDRGIMPGGVLREKPRCLVEGLSGLCADIGVRAEQFYGLLPFRTSIPVCSLLDDPDPVCFCYA